jgi:hypothetical protein
MVDTVADEQGGRNVHSFEKALKKVGFTNIEIEPAKQITLRRMTDRILNGSESIIRVPQTYSPLYAIFAIK